MRFAWQRKKSSVQVSVTDEPSLLQRLIMIAYNVVWWVPIVLPVVRVIDYPTGFVTFLVVTIIRVTANLLRNNVLKPEQAERFPLRSP
jgi:hypothetical protein